MSITGSTGSRGDTVVLRFSVEDERGAITLSEQEIQFGAPQDDYLPGETALDLGRIDLDISEHVDKRTLRFMGPGAAYAHIAMSQAIADAGLEEDDIVNPRTGLVAGSGGPSTSAMLAAHQTVLEKGSPKRIGPFAVPKCMSSTVSANLSTAFRIKGMNFSITSACSTSLHCIGMAAQQ
ncbi:beta-ketoacyl synthase N-terminal-like domain-containing protein, partial [Marivita sp.]|uniref:beta-ketoacyl synthase N-terminal-like domain-containing protein n=1 Tax=Marivita sp. TaxID=2003365 RepID=UPI0025C591CC